jgi:tRNA1(Val) A37 N6-methylase TrmN6
VPEGTGLVSAHPQRAGARIELRGSVFDYCRAAKRWMAPGGRFCFVMQADDPRTEPAPVEAGLTVVERWDYVFGRGRRPHIATLVCAHADEVPVGAERATGRLVIRGPDGEWTEEYHAFRHEMGVVE